MVMNIFVRQKYLLGVLFFKTLYHKDLKADSVRT